MKFVAYIRKRGTNDRFDELRFQARGQDLAVDELKRIIKQDCAPERKKKRLRSDEASRDYTIIGPIPDLRSHQHDCTDCLYLGTCQPRFEKDVPVDCYWCNYWKESNPGLISVLGRYGSEGSQYGSASPPEGIAMGTEFYSRADRWYLFSMLRAIETGLYHGK